MWLTVRTDSDPMALAGALRREVAVIDPLVPVANVQPLTSLVADRSAEPRLTMLIFGIFATAALLLAAVGLYGIISCSVAQRTREIGVTLALGAPRGRVVRRVLRDGMQLAVAGVVVGALVAFWGTGILRAILYDTEPGDALTYAGVAGLLLAVAALASAVPAWRAARLDPVEALRGE
jgi:ABC-type antimicrobial peptide transport system permease subunit